MVAGGGEIDVDHLPPEVAGETVAEGAAGAVAAGLRPLSVAVEEFEREYLLRALRLTGGERTRAAGMLGISRKCLWEKLRKGNVRGRHGGG